MSRRGLFYRREDEALRRREAAVGRLWDQAHQENVEARGRLVRAQRLERDLARREGELAQRELEAQAKEAALSLEEARRPVPRATGNPQADRARRLNELFGYALEQTDNLEEAWAAAELAFDAQQSGETVL